MTALEPADPDSRTPAQIEFDDLMAKWEGKPNLTGGQTQDEYYIELAGFMLAALRDRIEELTQLSNVSWRELISDDRDTDRRVASLESAMNQLQPCPELPVTTLEVFEPKPTIRVRIQLSSAVKDGHRVSETTVEWTGTGPVDHTRMEEKAVLAYNHGAREAERRNMLEAAS